MHDRWREEDIIDRCDQLLIVTLIKHPFFIDHEFQLQVGQQHLMLGVIELHEEVYVLRNHGHLFLIGTLLDMKHIVFANDVSVWEDLIEQHQEDLTIIGYDGILIGFLPSGDLALP